MALSKKQKAIASKAAPFDKITGADFKIIRKIKELSKGKRNGKEKN